MTSVGEGEVTLRRRSPRVPLPWLWALSIALVACQSPAASTTAGAPSNGGTGSVIAAVPSTSSSPASAGSSERPASSASAAGPSAAPHLTYVALGDSLLFALAKDCEGCSSATIAYGTRLATDLGRPVEVHNLTMHNGLNSAGLRSYLENNTAAGSALEEVVTAVSGADIVTITIGFNDIAFDDGAGAAALVKAFEANLDVILDRVVAARTGRPTILRVTEIYNNGIAPKPAEDPDGPGTGVSFWKPIVEAQNAAICRSAVRHDAICVDIYHAFNGPKGLGSPAALGYLGADGTHPSQKGQDAIAATLIASGYAPLK